MIEIFPAKPEDLETLLKLGSETFLESHTTSAPSEDIRQYVEKNFSKSKVAEELNDQRNIFHIVRSNGEIAGYSKIIPNTANPLIESKNVAKLERLYIKKEFYGQKLGLKLFQFNLEIARNLEQQGLWLFVWIGNERAIRFYRQAGFTVIGETSFKISETHSNPNHWMYLRF